MKKPAPPPPSIWDRIGDAWESLGAVLQGVILVGLAVGTIYAFVKWSRPKVTSGRNTWIAMRDTFLGREPVRDSITHKVISPGVPSIGERMASQEEASRSVAEAVAKLVQDSHRLDAVERRQESTDRRVERIETALSIDKRLASVEGIHMWRAVEAVAQSDPPENPPPVED